MSAFSRLASGLRSLPSWAARYIDNRLAAIEASVAGLSADGTFSMASAAANKVVYGSSANTVALADADDIAKNKVVGFTVSAPTGSTAVVRFAGIVTAAGSFTAWAPQYASAASAGALTETAPTAPYAIPVGIAINTTDLLVLPSGLLAWLLRGLTTTTGANVVGYDDSGSKTAAASVGDALDEIYLDATTSKLVVPVRLFGAILAAGTPLAAFADNAGASAPGLTLANSKALGIRWNNQGTQTAVWCEPIEIPYEADISQNATLRILCSKVGATVGDATTFTVTAFAETVGQLHDADSDFGGTSTAITGNATSKTIQASTLTLTAANLAAAAAPAALSLSIKPTDGTLGTDDIIVHEVVIEFVRKLRTS